MAMTIVGSVLSAVGALIFLRFLFRNGKILATRCGHMTKVKDKISAFGETTTWKVQVENGKTKYCHACIATMAIPCARCGKPIFIGYPVTLYPEDAMHHHVGAARIRGQHVGCMRESCAGKNARPEGFWSATGEIRYGPSRSVGY